MRFCPNITLMPRANSVLLDVAHKAIDYTGKRIGYMTILGRVSDDQKLVKNDKYVQWQARCDCGNEVILDSRQIRRTPNRSCGCQWRVHAPLFSRDPKETNINNYMSRYKGGAKKRHLSWSLTKDEFERFIFSSCYYCGALPSIAQNVFNKTRYKQVRSEQAKRRHEDGLIRTNGIDRIDSNLGYSLDNCVTSCKDCNYGKHVKTTEEFLKWINRVWNHQHKNQ